MANYSSGAILILCSLNLISSCKKADSSARSSAKDIQTMRTLLAVRRSEIRTWAERCEGSVAKENCDVGDALLFDGILCLSGEKQSCLAVKNAQGNQGQMWRALSRIGKDSVNSFSRDMSLGVLAYLVATKDLELANHWMQWIVENKGRTCEFATDNRCDFTPGFWSLFGDVWQYLGLPKNSLMENDFVSDNHMLPLQVGVAPSGYPLHLLGVDLLLREAMHMATQSSSAATLLLLKRDSQNPFFQFLNHSEYIEIGKNILQTCPSKRPLHTFQWSFERTSSEEAWRSSMGWECIALINFLN